MKPGESYFDSSVHHVLFTAWCFAVEPLGSLGALDTMVAGPRTIKSHLRDMCLRLGLPEGEFILLRYSQVETMSDLYYRMPTLEMFEDFLYTEMFPYSGPNTS